MVAGQVIYNFEDKLFLISVWQMIGEKASGEEWKHSVCVDMI
jgi:hypothetical protein